MAGADAVPAWTADIAALQAQQQQLARQVNTRDGFPTPLRTVAGFAVGSDDDGASLRAAAVLLEASSGDVLERQVARVPTRMPHIPGLLGFLALPALLEALALLRQPPDLAFILGHGIAHPRRLGVASHFGVVTGLPSIGVANEVLTGAARMALHDMRGAFTPVRDGREQIGWLLRSKPDCPPLVVSPGHKVAMPSAPALVMRYVTGHRLPEPVRLADRLASGNAGNAE